MPHCGCEPSCGVCFARGALPDVLPVLRSSAMTTNLCGTRGCAPPRLRARAPVDADRHRGEHEHLVAPDDRRAGSAAGNLDLPADVLRLAPLERRVRRLRHAGGVRVRATAARIFSGVVSVASVQTAQRSMRAAPHRSMSQVSWIRLLRHSRPVSLRRYVFQMSISHARRVRRRRARSARELARELGFTRALLVADRGSWRPAWSSGGRPAAGGRRDRAVTRFTISTPIPTRAWSRPAAPSRPPHRVDSHRRARRRQLARLRQGHQLRPHQRRHDARLPRLRQSRRGRCCRRSACRRPPAPAARRSRSRSFPTPRRTPRWRAAIAKAAFRVAILDPELTVSQPRAGHRHRRLRRHLARRRVVRDDDAGRNASDLFARDALAAARVRTTSACSRRRRLEARGAMLWGAHPAGIAIEQSMLGATHACANPADGALRHHARHRDRASCCRTWSGGTRSTSAMPTRACCARAAACSSTTRPRRWPPTRTADGRGRIARQLVGARCGAGDSALAADAATQWTGTHNPRPFDDEAARQLYVAGRTKEYIDIAIASRRSRRSPTSSISPAIR